MDPEPAPSTRLPKLNSSNFRRWKEAIEEHLNGRGLLSCVQKDLPQQILDTQVKYKELTEKKPTGLETKVKILLNVMRTLSYGLSMRDRKTQRQSRS